MRLSDEPGCYDDAYGRWLWAKGPQARENARVTMPGERKTMEYYTFAGADDTTPRLVRGGEMSNAFLDDAAQRFPERPLFLHAGFYAPHPPLNPPASALAQYANRDLPPRYWSEDEPDFLPPVFAQRLRAWRARYDSEQWDAYRRHFYAMVTHLDENVGKMMRKVKELGLWERTIWVLTSDHGDYLGDHGIAGKSDPPYDGAMRIPLVIAGPGRAAGQTHRDGVGRDRRRQPTLLEMAGASMPQCRNEGIRTTLPVMNAAARAATQSTCRGSTTASFAAGSDIRNLRERRGTALRPRAGPAPVTHIAAPESLCGTRCGIGCC